MTSDDGTMGDEGALESSPAADAEADALGEQEIPPPASVPVPEPASTPKVWPPAEIIAVSPSKGPLAGGTRITLVGKHLHRESIVRIGGLIAEPIGSIADAELSVQAPASDEPGAVDISIQNPGADLTVVEAGFRYEQ